MRPASAILLVIIVGCLLAQAPMGIGPSSLIQTFVWYNGTPSGCSAGARGMCVGSANCPGGDSLYYTGWMADASLLPITTGLPLVGTSNDFASKTCSGNLMLMQLAAFSWATPNASLLNEINCMTSYGTSQGVQDTPAGWYGHCTSNDNNPGCSWKSRTPFAVDGILYLPVERQISSGAGSIHDATLIESADGGATWKNPYTVAHTGTASATGDAPLCGSTGSGTGHPCVDATYTGSIMWAGIGAENWLFYQYGQDGALPSNVTDQCNPTTYVCAILNDGTVGRVLRSDLPSLDVTKWQYVSGVSTTGVATFTATFANRAPTITFGTVASDIARVQGILSGPVYLAAFHSYLMTGYMYTPNRVGFLTSLGPFGPWRLVGSVASGIGFISPNLALSSTVSTSPPRINLTTVDNSGPGPSGGSPEFAQWDIVLGMQPGGRGDAPAVLQTGAGQQNSGWIFGSGEEPGTFSRRGLLWAFDFMDHGGITASAYPFFHDVANGSTILYPCYSSGPGICGGIAGGIALLANGVQTQNGYGARFESNVSDISFSAVAGNQNAPSAMQGNGTFTVAGVFRIDSSPYNAPFWETGNPLGNGSQAVGGQVNSAGNLGVWWSNDNVYGYVTQGTYAPTVTNWYFMAHVLTAGTPNPSTNLWVGVGGALLDKLAGVSRASTGDSPSQTAAVTATPLIVGNFGVSPSLNASYAALLVYDHAFSLQEAKVLYQVLKTKMAARGITVQ